MSSTYLALCQKFRKLVGITGSGPSTVTGQSGMNEKITIWVRDAEEWVRNEWEDWDFLFEPKEAITVTASTSTFSLDDLSITDLAFWKEDSFVRDPGTDDYQKLAFDIPYDEYLKSDMYLGATVTGQLERVVIRTSDNALIFYPTYGSATTVWGSYYKAPTVLTSDADTSLIPARLEDVILYRAKMYYAEAFEDVALYESANVDYTRTLTKLMSACAKGFKGMQKSSQDRYEDIVVE